MHLLGLFLNYEYGGALEPLLSNKIGRWRREDGSQIEPSTLPVFCRETHTHTQFFQSVVSSADLSTDRSTSPYNRSLVSRRPLHRHGPSAVFKAFPRDNQVDERNYLQSRDTDRSSRPSPIELPRHEDCVAKSNCN